MEIEPGDDGAVRRACWKPPINKRDPGRGCLVTWIPIVVPLFAVMIAGLTCFIAWAVL